MTITINPAGSTNPLNAPEENFLVDGKPMTSAEFDEQMLAVTGWSWRALLQEARTWHPSYRPTISASTVAGAVVAEAFDKAMEALGYSTRSWRGTHAITLTVAEPKSGMQFETLADIKAAITETREQTLRAARKEFTDVPCFFSRGTCLVSHKKNESNMGDCPTWDGTMREIRKVVAAAEANPEILEVTIACGYDGADSPYAYYEEQEYEPWVTEFEVTIWTR